MGKTRDLFKKTGDKNLSPKKFILSIQEKRTFHAKMGTIKVRNSKDLTEAEEIRKRLKNTQKSYTKKVLITQMVWSLTSPHTSWSVKSRGPYKALLGTKLVEMMEFQLSYFKC